jgi:cell division protein ZapA
VAQVNVTVNQQSFRIACEDGQEDRLLDLAKIVDDKVSELVGQVGQVGQNRLLVMAALVIADELVDLRDFSQNIDSEFSDENQQKAALRIEKLSKRIESIADWADGA